MSMPIYSPTIMFGDQKTLGRIFAACIIEHEHANIFHVLMSACRERRFDPSYECMRRRSDPSGSKGFSR
jgi:hypothetical protein